MRVYLNLLLSGIGSPTFGIPLSIYIFLIFNRFNDTRLIKRIYGTCQINNYEKNDLTNFFYYLTKLEEDSSDESAGQSW